MFYLALTFGLEDDPIGALERMAGFVEAAGHRHGIEEPLQMTVGLSDGERVYAARYASGPEVNTLFVSTSVQDVRLLLPAEERFRHFSDEARVVVSEPLIDLPGLWHEIPAVDGADRAGRPGPRPPVHPTPAVTSSAAVDRAPPSDEARRPWPTRRCWASFSLVAPVRASRR